MAKINMTEKYPRSERIDYISFSFAMPTVDFDTRAYHDNVFHFLRNYAPALDDIFSGLKFESGGGRKPYSNSWVNEYVSIFYNPKLPHALCQVAGHGCNWLTTNGTLQRYLEGVKHSCTRIDLAVDIEVGSENQALNFVNAGYSSRFKSSGLIEKQSGTTFYIGSRKSELFCRVYQYNPPNPRANALRVETECKGDTAKRVAQAYLNSGLSPTINTVMEKYEFMSPFWQPDNCIMADMPARTGKQSDQNTVHWFYTQVQPAFLRLVRDGIIDDPVKFLKECFLDELENEE